MSINNGQEKIRKTITTSRATNNRTNVIFKFFTAAKLRIPCFWHMVQYHWITGSLHLQGNAVSSSTGIEMSENILTLKDEETILRPNIRILLHRHAESYPRKQNPQHSGHLPTKHRSDIFLPRHRLV
jgi:hypothetical protein